MTIKWVLPTALPLPNFNLNFARLFNPVQNPFSFEFGNFNYPPILLNNSIFSFSRTSIPTFTTLPKLFSYQVPNYTKNNPFSSSNIKSIRFNGGFGNNLVQNAKSYLGFKESDNSYKLFTNGRKEAWCADFVSYVVKDTCKKTGKASPKGFGSSSVEGLRQWGKNNGCYLETASSANKTEKIKNNVKAGDVIIFKENGKSHTGIVKHVDSNGKITTIEGNTSNKVAERTYSANNNTISGFIQLA